jgi:hypothetical protein
MKEFIDYVSEGRELLQSRNDNSWALGDLLVSAVVDLSIKPGRPTDPEATTLGDLAREMDVETPRASEWLSVAAFYPSNVRTISVSWAHYNAARRASRGDTDEQKRDNALELLETGAALAMGITKFRSWLKGEWYHGYIERAHLPPHLQAVIPNDAKGAAITLKRADD